MLQDDAPQALARILPLAALGYRICDVTQLLTLQAVPHPQEQAVVATQGVRLPSALDEPNYNRVAGAHTHACSVTSLCCLPTNPSWPHPSHFLTPKPAAPPLASVP